MEEQFRGDDDKIITMAIRQGCRAAEATLTGDEDVADEHRLKSRKLLGIALYAWAQV